MSTDAELLEKWDQGDEAALEELLRRYQDRIFSYLIRMLGNRHDAEEAAQEALIKAVRSLRRYREEGHFRSWLFSIAHREGLKCIRRRKKTGMADAESMPDKKDDAPNPAQNLAGRERVRQIELAIDSLPDMEKQVVLLRVYSGMKFKDIADTVGSPLNTVLGRMRNALMKLRGMIDELS